MSAITGIFYRDGRNVDEKQIKKMNDRLSHRGPDGSAIWCEGPVALGHQMLHTTPESLHERLPFEEDGLVITADARIDNRKELSEKLEIEDKEEVSDSYFILKAYQKWGEKCPEELLGDFAFAIWDKDEEKLFCARDHMGVKQFYYYKTEEGFYFATEMKALFTIKEVPRRLNELKLAFFMTINTFDKLFTFYEDILRLIPAHFLIINQRKFKIEAYWELDPNSKIIMGSDEDYIKSFREIFAESVKCRLRSVFPIGFNLSGGLDSSSIVGMGKKILKEKKDSNNILNTYSYIFDDFPQVDERYYIKKIINSERIEPHFICGDKIKLLDQIENILKCIEQPFYTPNMAIIWDSYQKMESDNIRVLLGGSGGDETVSQGTFYLNELAITYQWKKLIKELEYLSKRINIRFFKLFLIYFLLPFIPEFLKKLLPNNRDMFKKDGSFILNEDLVKRLGGEEYLKNIKWKPFKETKTAKRNHYLSITSDHYVLDMLDRSTSFFSIEPRYPYFDKRLIEFCYAIPSEMKFKLGWNRYIQRTSMDGIIPNEIQWRSQKTNFTQIYETNLLSDNFIEKIICNGDIIQNYVDLDTIKNIYKNYKKGMAGNDSFALWLSMLLFLWLKMSNFE